MFKLQKEQCTVKSHNSSFNILCQCGQPFLTKYRNLPCYHIICSICLNNSGKSKECTVCQASLSSVEELHPNDNVLLCTVSNCNKGFMNFPSLKLHVSRDHSLKVDSMEDFYKEFGGIDYTYDITHTVVDGSQASKNVNKFDNLKLDKNVAENDDMTSLDELDKLIAQYLYINTH